MKDIIFNGVPWFDQNGNTVNAHGACIVREHDTYYLFGSTKLMTRICTTVFRAILQKIWRIGNLKAWH